MLTAMEKACVSETCRHAASGDYALLQVEEKARTPRSSTAVLKDACIDVDGHVSAGAVTLPSGGCFVGDAPTASCNASAPQHSTVVVITHMWTDNYFHGLIESLPRLAQFASESPDRNVAVSVVLFQTLLPPP